MKAYKEVPWWWYAGFLVAGLAMLYAAILQKFLYDKSPCHDLQPARCVDEGGEPVPINVWVVSGPYILVGMAEIFASITSLEYAFTKVSCIALLLSSKSAHS